jgi:hypothetical protein
MPTKDLACCAVQGQQQQAHTQQSQQSEMPLLPQPPLLQQLLKPQLVPLHQVLFQASTSALPRQLSGSRLPVQQPSQVPSATHTAPATAPQQEKPVSSPRQRGQKGQRQGQAVGGGHKRGAGAPQHASPADNDKSPKGAEPQEKKKASAEGGRGGGRQQAAAQPQTVAAAAPAAKSLAGLEAAVERDNRCTDPENGELRVCMRRTMAGAPASNTVAAAHKLPSLEGGHPRSLFPLFLAAAGLSAKGCYACPVHDTSSLALTKLKHWHQPVCWLRYSYPRRCIQLRCGGNELWRQCWCRSARSLPCQQLGLAEEQAARRHCARHAAP